MDEFKRFQKFLKEGKLPANEEVNENSLDSAIQDQVDGLIGELMSALVEDVIVEGDLLEWGELEALVKYLHDEVGKIDARTLARYLD